MVNQQEYEARCSFGCRLPFMFLAANTKIWRSLSIFDNCTNRVLQVEMQELFVRIHCSELFVLRTAMRLENESGLGTKRKGDGLTKFGYKQILAGKNVERHAITAEEGQGTTAA